MATLGLDTGRVKLKCVPGEAVRAGARDANGHRAPEPFARARNVHDGVAERAARQLPLAPTAHRINQHVDGRADFRFVQLNLNLALQRLQRHDPPRLLLLARHRPDAASARSVFGLGEYLNEYMLS